MEQFRETMILLMGILIGMLIIGLYFWYKIKRAKSKSIEELSGIRKFNEFMDEHNKGENQ